MISYTTRLRRSLHAMFALLAVAAVLVSSTEILFQDFASSAVVAVAGDAAPARDMPDCPPGCACVCACACTPTVGTVPNSFVPILVGIPKFSDQFTLLSIPEQRDAPAPRFRPPAA